MPVTSKVREQVRGDSEQVFDAQAASVGASVTTAVQRMDDLTLAARTLLAANPDLSNRRFAEWYRGMGVDRRFPGVAGFGYTERVPHARLGRFVDELAADPIPGSTKGSFELVPPGDRPAFCLARLGVGAHAMAELGVSGLDLCALSKLLDSARDSGSFSAFVVSADDRGGAGLFEVIAPVYRSGGVPTTSTSGASASRAGSSACSTPARSCARRSPGRRASLSRSRASTRRCAIRASPRATARASGPC